MAELQIEICKAKEEDMPYIEEKLKKYVLDATNADWRQFFVIKNAGKTVAFARILDHGEYFEIASLGVDYYHRGKGLGGKLLRFLVEEARRLDSKKPIYGTTHIPELLGKVGFEEVYSYPEYLEYKKNHICKYPYKIKIMKYKENSPTSIR